MAIQIQMAQPDPIDFVAKNLRAADRREACRITNSDDAVRAVLDSAAHAQFTLVGLESGTTPVAIAGVTRSSHLPDAGIPWLVGTDRIAERPLQFLRKARSVLDLMFEMSGAAFFYNIVDAENDVHQQWLKWVGADFASAPIRVNGFAFFKFTIRRP